MGRRPVSPALSLNRLYHYGRCLFVNCRARGIEVVKRHVNEFFDKRLKPGLNLFLARGRHSGHGPAVEGLFPCYYLKPLHAFIAEILPREFYRGLVGLCSGVAKKRLPCEGILAKEFREFRLL